MNIEHIALYVNDLEAARDFFITYLGGKSNDAHFSHCGLVPGYREPRMTNG